MAIIPLPPSRDEGEERPSSRSLALQHALQARKPATPPTPVERTLGLFANPTDAKNKDKVKRIGNLIDRATLASRGGLYLEARFVKEERDAAALMESLIRETEPGSVPDIVARGATQDALERLPGIQDRLMQLYEAEASELIADR